MIKLINILEEIQSNKILIPRRSEERSKKYTDLINKKIQQYINDGSKGDLNLSHTKITSLPSGLKVNDSVYLIDTPLSKKYTKKQLKQMYPGIEGNIFL